MMPRKMKAAFYALAGPLMLLNGIIYRYLRQPKGDGEQLRIHLGPGQRNYINGWINLDANMFTGKCDLWVDLRNPLPFRDDSVNAVYSHHMIEHLPDIESHLREVHRCLAPNGVYRVAGPNGDSAIRKFVEGDLDWFPSWPDERTSVGGRFENLIFCRGEHLTILTESFLEELLRDAGFSEINRCEPSATTCREEFFADCLTHEAESDPDCPHTLVLEAIK